MRFPTKIKGLGWITAVYFLLFAFWLPVEGRLRLTIAIAVAGTAIWFLVMMGRLLGGRLVEGKWLGGLSAVIGTLFGLISNLMVLVFMAIKTGAHGHGPEYTTFQIDWIINQLPYWAGAGLLAGIGVALLISTQMNTD